MFRLFALMMIVTVCTLPVRQSNAQIIQGSEVELFAVFPGLEFFPTNTTGRLAVYAFPEGMGMYVQNEFFPPFWIDSSSPPRLMQLDEFGVGIGTNTPTQPLHVSASESSDDPFNEARILIQNNLSTVAQRNMLIMENPGGSRMVFRNTSTDVGWGFMTNNSDAFAISKVGSGGTEFSIQPDGEVRMGPAGINNFVLAKNGNLTIKGTLNEMSDRWQKKNFTEVNTAEILDKISNLPITTWSYQSDANSIRHLGPMAQDFYAAFSLGESETTISTIDASGVAMAGIQELYKENRALVVQVKNNQKQIDELQHQLGETRNEMKNLQHKFVQLLNDYPTKK